MHNYSIYLATENEKQNLLHVARGCGAIITAVSGCGGGYYVQLNATDQQAQKINNILGA